MDRKKIAALAIVVVLVCVAGAAYALSNDEDERVLVVETSPTFAPFEYMLDGEYVGIDMDIIRAVAQDMGYTVRFQTNTFDAIADSVAQGDADIGASGFTINDDRAQLVDFSIPYATANQVVVVPEGTSISSPEDLSGLTVSVQRGTTGAEYAKTLQCTVIERDNYEQVLKDLTDGTADCEIVDSVVAAAQVAADPDLKVLDILTDAPEEQYGVIFAQDNDDLCERFDNSLQRIIDTGLLGQIWEHYEENGFAPDTTSFYDYKKTLTIETSPMFPPFEYMIGTEFTGIDMDIMRAVGYELGYQMSFRDNTFDSIILSVTQGKCDIGASGFTISEERAEQVLFSDPYYEIKQVVVVPEGSDIETLEDLQGKRISVQVGTSGADYAFTVPGATVIPQKSYTEVILDLTSNSADCEIVDSAVAEAQVARTSGLKVLDILTDATVEYYGFIFAKSNQALCDEINAALAELNEKGIIDKIIGYYADAGFTEIPSFYSTAEVQEDESSGEGFWAGLWDRIYNDFIKNDRYSFIFEGLKNTIIISIVALLIGMSLGAVVAMVRSTHDQTGKLRAANAVCSVYVTVIRGTPVMLQLLIIYYVIFASSSLNSVLIASVAFGINSGAYVAEVIRSGISAVPKGQMEACRSLGMTNRMAMTSVILPQAVRNITPALGNESISLLKETSIAGYIGILDLTRGADLIRGQTYDALLPMIVAGAIYLAIVLVISYLFKRLERRLNSAY